MNATPPPPHAWSRAPTPCATGNLPPLPLCHRLRRPQSQASPCPQGLLFFIQTDQTMAFPSCHVRRLGHYCSSSVGGESFRDPSVGYSKRSENTDRGRPYIRMGMLPMCVVACGGDLAKHTVTVQVLTGTERLERLPAAPGTFGLWRTRHHTWLVAVAVDRQSVTHTQSQASLTASCADSCALAALHGSTPCPGLEGRVCGFFTAPNPQPSPRVAPCAATLVSPSPCTLVTAQKTGSRLPCLSAADEGLC